MNQARPIAVALLFTSVCVVACRKEETPQRTVVMALREPSSIDPAFLVASQDFLLAQQVHRMLFRLDAESGRPVGDLVEKLNLSADGRRCNLKLKADAVFEDGVPITAEVVARSMSRLADPSVASPGSGALVFLDGHWDSAKSQSQHTGIVVTGEHDLDLALSRPEPELASILASPRFSPVHPSVLMNPSADAYKDAVQIATSGQYAIKQWTPRQSMTLRPSANRQDSGRPELPEIEIRFTESEDTAYTWWQAGEADIVVGLVPFGRIPEIRQDNPGALVTTVSRATYFLLFNTTRQTWSNPYNRQTLARAINRSSLVDSVLGAGQKAAVSFLPLEGYGERFGVEACFPVDVRPDRKLPSGSRALLLTNGSETLKLIAEYLQSDISRHSGAEVELRLLEWGSFLATVKAGDFDLARMTFTGGADPLELLENFTTGHSNNFGGFSSKSYDLEVASARQSIDAGQRAAHIANAHRILCEQMPAVPVYLSSQVMLVSSRVSGLPAVSSDGWFLFSDIRY